MPLPHIQNVEAGRNLYDPMHESIFEIDFQLPYALTAEMDAGTHTVQRPDFALTSEQYFYNNSFTNGDIAFLTEQVTEVSGLDALQKTVQAGEQKFLGTSVSFLNPTHDNTYAEYQVSLNLNLKNTTDAWVLRVFKAWSRVGYDLMSGVRTLKAEYVAPFMRIIEANRNGVAWRVVTFKDVMLTNMTGLDALNYTSNEARKLQCTFRSDWWNEELGTGIPKELGNNSQVTWSTPVLHDKDANSSGASTGASAR